MRSQLLTLSLLVPTPAFAPADGTTPGASPEASREQRLEKLVEQLESARESMHVPGMSLAVVMDGEVALVHGFGLADVDSGRPVGPGTLFGIGSTTKAFTATLLGMLVDEGALTWDDPVAEHLPYFELDTGDSGEQATLRDLLCHRSGFTRMTMLSAAPSVPRETILKTAARAEPWAPFRKEFHYNNVMFLAAGMVAAEVAGRPWEELVATRILEPLGMSSSLATCAAARDAEQLARGYLWDEDAGELEPKRFADIDGIGPAGSIHSSAIDMARWLLFLTAHGEIAGERLIRRESLEETWKPQMSIAGDVSYGLGWMVREWNGQRLVEHGGNTEGFGAQVALLPDAGVGFALLTNTSITPLQAGSIPMVFEALLGELETGDATPARGEQDFAAFVGEYAANFASFKDATFTVQVTDDKLAVDVPGQTLYALKAPDEEGKWYFEMTDQIAVSFQRDEGDRVTGMTMYQAGYTFELPRAGVELPVEIPVEDLQRYLGEYAGENGEVKGEVVIQNNRLAIDVPGQMVFELHAPDDEQRRAFRVRSELGVTFHEDEDGHVDGLTLHQPQGDVEMERLSAASDTALPTVDEIVELRDPARRLAAFDGAPRLRYTGTARFVNAGLEGSWELLVDGRERYCEQLDFGVFGTVSSVVDGERGWSEDPLRGVSPMSPDELETARFAHPAVQGADWREIYDEVRVTDVEEEGGRRLGVLRLKREGLPSSTLYVDLENGDVVRAESVVETELVDVSFEATFEDFRDLGGVRVPFRVVSENSWNGRLVVQVEEVEAGVEVDAALFEAPQEATQPGSTRR